MFLFPAWLLWCKHSHTAVRFLVITFVVVHAQGHLAHFTAETALVPILGKQTRHRQDRGNMRDISEWNIDDSYKKYYWHLAAGMNNILVPSDGQ